jgi:hypothetical protein
LAHKKYAQKGNLSIFEKIGGVDGVIKFNDTLATNLLNEPTLAEPFAVLGKPDHRSATQLLMCLDAQICSITGGPFQYPCKTFTRGAGVYARDMKSSHAGLKITRTQFNTFNAIVKSTALAAGLPQADVDVIGRELQATMGDIVTVG